VSLVCALALLSTLPAPAAQAFSRLDIRAGYDSDPDSGSNQVRGDAWAAVTAGTTLARDTGGPLTISLDVALGATAFARLTELDRISLVVTPAVDYVISPRVAATLALVTEGQLVEDDDRSAWGWGGLLRLREQLSTRVSLAEYLSYRNLTARDAEYSGTKVAVGLFLRTYLGERWTFGAGGEYAHGDFLGGDVQGFGGTGIGTGSQRSHTYSQNLLREDGQPLVQQDEDRLSGSLALSYAWSEGWSSGVEYVYTRVLGNDGGEDQHAVIVSATYGF
jgi:hypothetical protein